MDILIVLATVAVMARSGVNPIKDWKGAIIGSLAVYLGFYFLFGVASEFYRQLTSSPAFLPITGGIVLSVLVGAAVRFKGKIGRLDDPFSPFES